jgi:signal transduction histidine kinase
MDVQRSLMAALEKLVLARQRDGSFVLYDEPPTWFHSLGFDVPRRDEPMRIECLLPFLEAFLPEAEKAWIGEGARRVDSGCWTETTTEGEELYLEAMALQVGSLPLLVITRNDALFLERRRVLQRARELRLAHDALSREIEGKEVLIHCVIHDLAGPLSSIVGILSLLEEQPSHDSRAELIQGALRAAMRQRELIREILDTFTAERSALDVSYDDSAAAPDLRAAVVQVTKALVPMASLRGVRLLGPLEEGAVPPCKVIGEERRLSRVLFNLIENAIRFTPSGKLVRVALHEEPAWIRVEIEDEGSGVPPAVAPRLFQKFARGREPGAGTGLGLYFCRITIENWGGVIGYEARPEGGSRFWFRLRRAAET